MKSRECGLGNEELGMENEDCGVVSRKCNIYIPDITASHNSKPG